MNRFWTHLLDARVLGVLGLAALAGFLFLGANTLKLAAVYAAVAIAVALLVAFAAWVWRRRRARRAGQGLEAALGQEGQAPRGAPEQDRTEAALLRTRLLDAVKTIKTSKLGETTGAAALYELPWYMVIGNPSAGKSTAILQSGLKFPFADSSNGNQIIQGIGGTRNCDWFFTNEGILLDTAGRYSVQDEDRQEWLGFLALLKRHRPKAPINGIIIAASLSELSQARPEAAIQLARQLRQRVQELTEKLEVFSPVYLVFTKADLIAGFAEFFEDGDRAERNKVWGATLPFHPEARTDADGLFDKHFDELHNGLRDMAVARMSLHRGQALPPGVLTFPLEFAALKPALRSFVTTLFEENPYQFRPVFRGFYFTSAIQEGVATNRASDRIAHRFALTPQAERTTARVVTENGMFLKDLFSRVIFADRQLVRQYASRGKVRVRTVTFAVAVAVLALALGGWSWSYLGNRQLVANVRADLDKAVRLQRDRIDLASRLEALEILQDRIEQLDSFHRSRSIAVGLGLYQGDEVDRKLRQEYFDGVRQVMLQPVSQAIEAYLTELNANAAKLQPMTRPPDSGVSSLKTTSADGAASPGRFSEVSPESVEDGYNALKTYLMLADRLRMEPGHLTDQITRFWRGWLEANRGSMPRDQMIRSAERMISFSLANLNDQGFPVVPDNLALVDQTRDNLTRVVRGMPARERVYAEVKARAATRYAPMSVARIVGEADRDVVAGSYAVSGAYTREAWTDFIEPAFKTAATTELQSVDWVLKTAARDDLSLEGSPAQIRKTLTDLYKADYVREWQRFMQGVTVGEFNNFETAVARMNRLGDPTSSPIKKLMTTLFDQTSWDNPSLLNQRLGQAQTGFLEWFKQTILRQAPTSVEVKVDLNAEKAEIPMGAVGKEFAALSRLMMARDNDPPLINGYLKSLGAIRTRFNQMKTQGDVGPAARSMMSGTLEGANSELSDSLKFVDEQMMTGLTASARDTLRPLLVRPLMQSFTVIVGPTETEVNRLWQAQVSEPFQRTLAAKYPFDTSAKIEAAPQEIAKVFGPTGAIARFTDEALGTLVVRRGDALTPRTWADIGVRLRPEFGNGLASWVAPLEGAAAATGGGMAGGGGAGGAGGSSGATAGQAVAGQTSFQILPLGSPGISEYTVTIDGQELRYRNAAPAWTNFVWPNPNGVAGVRITALTHAGRSIELLNEPGRFGLTRMFESAQRKKLAGDINELSWTRDDQTVALQLRVISQPGAVAPAANEAAANTGGGSRAGSSTPPPTPVAASSFKGLRLPALVLGADTSSGALPATPAPSARPATATTVSGTK